MTKWVNKHTLKIDFWNNDSMRMLWNCFPLERNIAKHFVLGYTSMKKICELNFVIREYGNVSLKRIYYNFIYNLRLRFLVDELLCVSFSYLSVESCANIAYYYMKNFSTLLYNFILHVSFSNDLWHSRNCLPILQRNRLWQAYPTIPFTLLRREVVTFSHDWQHLI